MAAEGTSTVLIVSAVCFLLTFGSCFVAPSIGQEIGYFKTGEYDILMPMMLGAFLFLPLGFLFLLGGVIGSFFPSKDQGAEGEKEQNQKSSISVYWFIFTPMLTFIAFFIFLLGQGAI